MRGARATCVAGLVILLALVAVASTAGSGVAHKRVKPTPGTVIATDDFADPKATGWLLVD